MEAYYKIWHPKGARAFREGEWLMREGESGLELLWYSCLTFYTP